MNPKIITIIYKRDNLTDISTPWRVSFDKAEPIPWPAGIDNSRDDDLIECNGQPYIFSRHLTGNRALGRTTYAHGTLYRLAIGWNVVIDNAHDPRALTTRKAADINARATVTRNRALFGTALYAQLVPQHGLRIGPAVATLDGSNHTPSEAMRLQMAGNALPWDWEEKAEPDPDELIKVQVTSNHAPRGIEMVVLRTTTESRDMPIIREAKLTSFKVNGVEQDPPSTHLDTLYRWIEDNHYKPAGHKWLDKTGLHRRYLHRYVPTTASLVTSQSQPRLDTWAGYRRRRHGVY